MPNQDEEEEETSQEERDTILQREWSSSQATFDYTNTTQSAFKARVGEDAVERYRRFVLSPGGIQTYGVLIIINRSTLKVVGVSQNSSMLLGKGFDEILDQSVLDVFVEPDHAKIKGAITALDTAATNPLIVEAMSGDKVNIILNNLEDGLMSIDVEPVGLSNVEGAWQCQQGVRGTVDLLAFAESVDHLMSILVQEVARITGYDRTMVYQFADDAHGEVVAEFKSKRCRDAFMGLHYPATDIPRPAREAFLVSKSRMINDVLDVPCPIKGIPSFDPLFCNIGKCQLRAANPCHCQYLSNMGVRASLVSALILDDKLWGLLVCHHYYEPKSCAYQQRVGVEFVASTAMSKLTELLVQHEELWDLHVQRKLDKLAVSLGRAPPEEKFQRMVGTTGASSMSSVVPHVTGSAIFAGDALWTSGKVPERDHIERIRDFLVADGWVAGEVFATHCIHREVQNLEHIAPIVSGVMAVPVDKDTTLIWFRPEFQNVTRFAGNPFESSEGDGREMGPRKSFKVWNALNKLMSRKWTERDMRAAQAVALLVQCVDTEGSKDPDQMVHINAERIQFRAHYVAITDKLSKLMKEAEVPVFSVREDSSIVHWNKQAEILSGYPAGEIAGMSLCELCGPKGQEEIEHAIQNAIQHAEISQFELTFLSSTAQPVTLLIYSVSQGPGQGEFLFIGQDISCTKPEIPIEEIPTYTSSPLFLLSENGKVEHWNAAMETLTGTSSAAVSSQMLLEHVFPKLLKPMQESSMVAPSTQTLNPKLHAPSPKLETLTPNS